MTASDLPPQEWSYVARGLREQVRNLPKTGTFQPCYNATSWDHDDLYRAVREDAIRSRTGVLQLITDWKAQGPWPRGRYEAKFWLRPRWEQAEVYAQALAMVASDSVDCGTCPKDVKAAISWLMYDMWDEILVDHWLADNLGTTPILRPMVLFPKITQITARAGSTPIRTLSATMKLRSVPSCADRCSTLDLPGLRRWIIDSSWIVRP